MRYRCTQSFNSLENGHYSYGEQITSSTYNLLQPTEKSKFTPFSVDQDDTFNTTDSNNDFSLPDNSFSDDVSSNDNSSSDDNSGSFDFGGGDGGGAGAGGDW